MFTGRKILAVLIPVLIVTAFTGCREKLEPITPDYVEYGWELYALEDYRGSIPHFVDGAALDADYADAWNGLGWAYAGLGDADSSALNFTTGKAIDDTTAVGDDILAGLAFAKLAQGEYAAAILNGETVLARTPSWSFTHNTSLTSLRLALTVATAYYGLGEFDSSLVWIQRELNETFLTDVSTLQG
ncbi:MAG: hypothetical protein KAU50_05950, partial [Candidatus Marinimicrobia bacterium]|nr:hypothetical protein [Candidatus Neomarinimicrobiota bacterium]